MSLRNPRSALCAGAAAALLCVSLLATVAGISRAQVVATVPPAGAVDTVAPAGARETDYAITSGKLILPGTLTLPAKASGRIPVVLIVAGSGPTDRNGNSVAPGYAGPLPRPNSYAQLAWALAGQGIASVRYDKRSLGANAAKIDLPATSIDDFIGDVAAGAKQLAADARFSRVVLFGHSEGAQLVLQAANRGAPAAGVIMASGMGRRFLPVLHQQLQRQLDSATLLQFDSAIAGFLRNENPTVQLPAVLMSLLQPENRRFMQGLQAYVPTDEIAAAKVPIMIVQGAKDIQVTEEDSKLLATARPTATLLVLPTANHVLKAANGRDVSSQISLYMDPRSPIVPDLAPAIAVWIRGLK